MDIEEIAEQPCDETFTVPACNVTAREHDRQKIAADTRAFIANGGKIQSVDHRANQPRPTMAFNNKRIDNSDANNFLFGGK